MPDENLDLLKRVDTTLLYPPFLELQNQLLNNCVARGRYYVATSGTRTYAQQQVLFDQGRTTVGRIVTKAKPGYSPHNFFCAVDYAPHIGKWEGKLNPDYSEKNYVVLGEEAKKLGLDWGGAWETIKDTPHVQLNLKRYGITWQMLRDEYRHTGMVGVFNFLDKYKWRAA